MRTSLGVVLLAVWACLSSGAPMENVPAELADNYRLPLSIMPLNYNITLQPYLLESDGAKRFTFAGEVFITVEVKEKVKQIVMHSKNLNFAKREYWEQGKEENKIALSDAVPNSNTDIVIYPLTNELELKNYVLHFVYTGSMDDDMHGFYRSSYTDSKNVTKWLGSTQFQTNHARRAFPSFDEPKFKAKFDVSLVRHKSMKTVSNSRLIRTTTNGNYSTDVYDTTPKMSTYILAFIVSEFNERFNGDFGVIARPEYYAQTEYSFEVGQELLKHLDERLGITYYNMGIDKMHLAAIPDFSAGAMENWGLLTYRERALLYDEGSSNLASKQYIAAVVAHEQAHMWFGDLVTCDWWSYTWLNEGFARYFQYFATAEVEKDLQMDQQFVVDQIQSVMSMDSTNSTNPMSDENTNTPADLGRMFNSISYNKGATFIRMVEYVLGQQQFKESVQKYLKTYQYTNTIPSNLFEVWKEFMPSPFKEYADSFFSSFTEQVGYPVVTFNLKSANTLEITQKRFLLKDNDGSNASLRYTVPITYTTSAAKNFNDTTPKLFIEAKSTGSQEVNLGNDVAWIIGNIQETGYYRVNYDNKTWHAIHKALLENNWSEIHELNRAQLVDDLFNLARASVIDYELTLEMIEYLSTETKYLPWYAAFNGYNYLVIRLGVDTANFARYIRDLTTKAYNMLGWEEKSTDSTLDIYNRGKILAWACKFGKDDCINKAKGHFKQIDTKPVPVNIRSVVYCTAMREGTEADFDKLFGKFQTETVATEETLALNSLGCVKNKALVTKFFNIVVSDKVRRQDKSSAFTSLYTENNENVEVVFDLIDEHLDALATSLGGYPAVASMVSGVASRFTTEDQLVKLKIFNGKNQAKFGSSYATLDAAEKTVADNLLWASKKLGVFKTFLEKRGRNGSATLNSFTGLTMILVVALVKIFH